MISAEHVKAIFSRGMWVIEHQVEGITHEQSLLQPNFRANCMNWVLGHLLYERQIVLDLLGLDRVLPAELTERYERDSEPIIDQTEDVLPLETLLDYLSQTEALFAEAFANIPDEQWHSEINTRGTKMWERMEFLAWHEGYHVGQLELLRQLAGKDDKVI